MKRISKWILCLLVCSVAMPATAGRWKVRSGLDFRTDYTGNVFLENEDTEKELVLSLIPRVSATKAGGRGSVSLNYRPELRYYTQGTQSNKVAHFLNATGDVELVKRVFGVQASARAGQTVVDRNQGFTSDGITNPENISDTYSVQLSPYLLPVRLGNYALLSINTDLTLVTNSDNRVSNSSGNRATINLESGREFNRLSWRLSSNRKFTVYEDANESTIGNLSGNAEYKLNRIWSLTSTLGYDENNIQTTRSINGFFWNAGFVWKPNSRASGRFTIGERYNRSDYDLNLTYRHRRASWTVDYNRTITTSQDEFLDSSILPNTDEFGNPIDDPTADANQEVTAGPSRNDAVFLSDRLRLRMNVQTGRTSWNVTTGYIRRDDLEIDDISEDLELGFGMSRNFTPRSSGTVDLRWLRHTSDSDSLNDYDQNIAQLNYTYKLSEDLSLQMGYRVTLRDSKTGDDFQEDRLFFQIQSTYGSAAGEEAASRGTSSSRRGRSY